MDSPKLSTESQCYQLKNMRKFLSFKLEICHHNKQQNTLNPIVTNYFLKLFLQKQEFPYPLL